MADGFRFIVSFHAVRRMIVGMAFGLLGGGALFVLGQPFSAQVLKGGDSGYGVIVTTLGIGVGLGMGTMTALGRRIERRQAVFALALVVTGGAIALAAFTSTVAGAAGWVFLAGAGTGVAYVTGFTHLHAVITDDIRGRTFAVLYAAVRVALLVSFGLAGVGAAALDGRLPGVFQSGVRTVILAAGLVIILSGGGALWAVRAELRGEPLDEGDYRTLRDAGDALTWMRGDRRSRGE
jgi:dTMP kinase